MSNFDANAIFFIKKMNLCAWMYCHLFYFSFMCLLIFEYFFCGITIARSCYLLGRSQSIRVWRLELWVKHRVIIEHINCSPNEKFAVDSILWTTATWITVRSMVDLLNKRNQNCRTGTRIFGWWHLSCSTIFTFELCVCFSFFFTFFFCVRCLFLLFIPTSKRFDFCEMHSI